MKLKIFIVLCFAVLFLQGMNEQEHLLKTYTKYGIFHDQTHCKKAQEILNDLKQSTKMEILQVYEIGRRFKKERSQLEKDDESLKKACQEYVEEIDNHFVCIKVGYSYEKEAILNIAAVSFLQQKKGEDTKKKPIIRNIKRGQG